MESELIDFSDREGEFLNSEVKQQAVSYAVISSVLGFILSGWLFLHHKVGPAGVLLDRGGAEGRAVAKPVEPPRETDGYSAVFHAPRIAGYRDGPAQKRPPWKDVVGLAVSVETSEREAGKQNRRQVAETTLGVVPEYRRAGPRSQAVTQAAERPKEHRNSPLEDLDRLLFPRLESRAEPSALRSVGARLAGNVAVLGNGRDEYHGVLVLDSAGTALVSSALAGPEFLGRIWVDGKLCSARVLATDSEFALSLIRIEGGSGFQEIPLSPVPPSTGERLLGFAQSGRSSRSLEFRSGMPFGKAGFFLDGRLDRSVFGTPLLNNRGELAGYYVSALPGVPGSGIHLAVDSSVLYRLLRGYKGGAEGFSETERDAVATLLASLGGEAGEDKVQRGRVIPGVGLSDLYLGMPIEDARKKVSAPEISRFGATFEAWQCPAPPMTLFFAQGVLLAAASQSQGYSTLDGLAVGADVDSGDLRKLSDPLIYPDLVSVPGLEIILGTGERIAEFVVKPSYRSR